MENRILRLLLATAVVGCLELPARAVTLWFEGGENGLGSIQDQTPSSYSLLQSDVVGAGDYAFHLANPSAAPGRFIVDPGVSPQSDSNLYFLSRLGGATSSQVASVEVSTNQGSSWQTVYSQQGSGYPGEGAFSLKEVSLSPYASQSVSFRFSLEASGSYYPQTSVDVGWLLDSLQIGDTPQKTLYSVGEPTAVEQLMLEYVNRSRADALVEADRLAYTDDPQIQSAMQYFGETPQSVIASFQSNVDSGFIDRYAQPLAFSETLGQAADLHTLDQFTNAFQGHESSANPPAPLQPYDGLGQRVDRVGGYSGGLAENVYSYAESVAHGHAGFDIDWGVPSLGHRRSIHDDDYQEIGIGILEGSNGGVGPMLITQNFGSPGEVAFVTGVVYEDLDGDNFYDVGEGRGGVRIDVDGSPYYAISTESGAYAVPVSSDGSYQVSFSGDGFAPESASVTVDQLRNVKVDYLATALPETGDFNGDGVVDAADYTVWRDNVTGEYTQADYDVWASNYGTQVASESAAVPEPTTLWLLAMISLAAVSHRARA